jgi:hypothetical protein
MRIDLRTCVPGQLVELRNGNIVKYMRRSKYQNQLYPHIIGECSYTDDGSYYSSKEEDDDDVVKIFSVTESELPEPEKHPSVAWWESCPWITDRTPTKEDGNTVGWVMAKLRGSSDIITTSWSKIEVGRAWIHRQDWQPPALTDKEQALELLNKHEGGWCPTPKEWTIIRKGLTE